MAGFEVTLHGRIWVTPEGKPDPEVYLVAASRVGALPGSCIVVEDAAAGIEGARRAGMRSIGVAHDGNHLQADVVVESLDQLDPDAFDKLLQADPRAPTALGYPSGG
jgi:beta-phosphoglucomutase